jgi:hypothetical protein
LRRGPFAGGLAHMSEIHAWKRPPEIRPFVLTIRWASLVQATGKEVYAGIFERACGWKPHWRKAPTLCVRANLGIAALPDRSLRHLAGQTSVSSSGNTLRSCSRTLAATPGHLTWTPISPAGISSLLEAEAQFRLVITMCNLAQLAARLVRRLGLHLHAGFEPFPNIKTSGFPGRYDRNGSAATASGRVSRDKHGAARSRTFRVRIWVDQVAVL